MTTPPAPTVTSANCRHCGTPIRYREVFGSQFGWAADRDFGKGLLACVVVNPSVKGRRHEPPADVEETR